MSDFSWGLMLLGTYVVLVILARWIYIARTNVIWTSAQAKAMVKRLSLQVPQDPSSNGKATVNHATLEQLLAEIKIEIKAETPQRNHSGVLGWNGSHQIAQWVLMCNRATWIILVALLPLAVLAGMGYGMLLVAGAIGGLVSRMQRLVFSTRIPVTYGSSWAPLFCAPILGALAAWAGLVLISLLQTTGVLQLTALQTSLDNLRTPSAAVLGTAILLGMSERFLLRLEKQAEAVIDPDRAGPMDQTAPANTSAAAQRGRLLRLSASPATTTEANAAERNGHPTPASVPAGQAEEPPDEA